MNQLKILLVVESYQWMGINSGLLPLVRGLSQRPELQIATVSGVLEDSFKGMRGKLRRKLWYLFPGRARRRMRRFACCGKYDYGDYAVESDIVSAISRQKPDLVHHLFGDTRHGYVAGYCQLHSIPFVATVHKPLSFRKLVGFEYQFLKKASAVVTVGPEERDEFEALMPGRAHFIPHGVALDFFKPAGHYPGNRIPFTCVTAGGHLRDYPLLLESIRLILAKDPAIRFRIVLPVQMRNGAVFEGLAVLPQVTFHANLSDAELLKVYHESHCLLLPLVACTANNTLLEGMACGLPVITTDLPGTRAYTDASFASYHPAGNALSLAEAVIDLKASNSKAAAAGKASRKHAEVNFDWSVIGSRHLKLYGEVLAEKY